MAFFFQHRARSATRSKKYFSGDQSFL